MKAGWEQAKDIFVRAISLAPDERLQFVEQECSNDPLLFDEVKSLIDSYRDDSFLETPAASPIAESTFVESARFATGQALGHYQIVRQLGTGGMGEVYLAKDQKLDRKVAIKILNKRFSVHEANVERFTREAKAVSALNHPNILVIHEIGDSDKPKYIVSEYIDGRTLRDVLKDSRMAVSMVLDIAVQVASALAAAHGERIIHRDIKPENIMIRPDSYVKVLDFGLAKLLGSEKALFHSEGTTELRNQTAKGMILGTINYMSPEQAKGEHVDERTDIFSLGALLYEMVAGRAPFEGESLSESFANLINAEPPPLSRHAKNIPDELQRIVSKLLRKNRDERYQTMVDLLSDLRSLRDNLVFDERLERSKLSGETGEPKTTTGIDGNLTTGILGKNTRTGIVAAVIVATLLIGGLGAYYLYSFRLRTIPSNERKTLAILPLVNSSQDPNIEYLSDGITEDVINNLSRVSGLKVMSRNSSFKFRSDENDIRGIASKLGVENVITGDIKQLGDRLIVNIHLIDANDDSQIWGNQYIRTTADIFAVQADIASDVAQNLRVRLTETETQRLKKRYTDNVEAYQLFLKGQYAWNKHTLGDLQKSIDFFNQALEKDPNYALAYFGLSAAYGVLGNDYVAPREAYPKAKAYAAKAIEIDETLGEAHTAMAAVDLYYDWDWASTESELRRAKALDPDSSQASLIGGDVVEIQGRFDEAKIQRKHSLEIDPLLPQFNFVAGATSYFAGEYDDAIVQLGKTIELEPRYYPTYQFLGQAYEQKKMYAEAIETYQKGITQSESGPELIAALGHAYALQGDRNKAEMTLDELRKLSKERYISPYWFAQIYVGLGDKDEALNWLEKAYQDHSGPMIWLKVEPLFSSMRGDARFQDLLHRIGL
jgi:serine/threonine protein kinase/tetratricopeptide (TPR) repeat protein